jgi:hypothetical protein
MTALARTNNGVAMAAPANMSELWKFCQTLSSSDLVPKDYKNKPENVLAAVQMGAELGLHPMQALQGIAVINGRPSVWGDLMLALVQSHPDCEDVKETFDAATQTARCEFKRRGRSLYIGEFSMADAKVASLWDKAIWKQYPKRMLKMRARAFALRDGAADWLRGLSSAEEQMDVVEARASVVTEREPSKPHLAAVVEPRALPAQAPSTNDNVPTSDPYQYYWRLFKNSANIGKHLSDVPTESLATYIERLTKATEHDKYRADAERYLLAAEAEMASRKEPQQQDSVSDGEDADYDQETGEVTSGPADDFRGQTASVG